MCPIVQEIPALAVTVLFGAKDSTKHVYDASYLLQALRSKAYGTGPGNNFVLSNPLTNARLCTLLLESRPGVSHGVTRI